MTALAGYWAFGRADDPLARCQRMLRAQQIYAPDDPVVWNDGALALGRRLYRLLPEDRFDRGPVTGGGGRWTLVGDVRLDNREELGEALAIEPGRAAGLSDMSMVTAAVERWAEGALDRLVGEFALAIWDRDRERLMLARDYIGQRPLHYHRGPGFFAFATMAKGLHALPELPTEPNFEAIAAFVALIPENGNETVFKGIEKVPGGHVVTVTRDGIGCERWWRPRLRDLGLKGPAAHSEALREQLDRAVKSQLRGAGEVVASHLSAGLDSSAVTATAARLLAPEGRRVAAFTSVPRDGYSGLGHPEAILDEGPLAAAAAAMHPNVDHILVPGGGSPVDSLDRNFFLYERPVLNLCNAVWSNKILDLARGRGLKVLLTGARGNMSISYDGMPLLSELAASGRLLRLARESWALVRRGARVGTVAAQAVGPFLPVPLWRGINRLRGRGASLTDYTVINPEAIESMGLMERAAARGLDSSYRPRRDALETRLWVLARTDTSNYNKGALAGWGIDTRDPTGDRRLVEFCLSVPLDQYLHKGVRRALARTAFADRLPAELLNEPRKGYQAADWHEGLAAARGALGEEVERIAAFAPAGGVVDSARMDRLCRDWPQSGWEKRSTMEKYRLALMRGVSAGHFLRKASGSNQ